MRDGPDWMSKHRCRRPRRPTDPRERARPVAAIGHRAALVIAIGGVVSVSLYRVITLGFVPVAPDDAAYIGVGRAIWRFREPLGIDGTLYTIRS